MEAVAFNIRPYIACCMQQFLFNGMLTRFYKILPAPGNYQSWCIYNIKVFYGVLNLLGAFDLQKSLQEPENMNFK